MAGALIGALCGVIEFFLLKRLTAGVTSQQGALPVGTVLAKIAVLAACMLLCAFTYPKQLIWAATACCGVLIVCCIVSFVIQTNRDKNKG